MAKKNSSTKEERENSEKIRSLQEMIATAERTISSAKQMLTQVQESQTNSPAVGGGFSSDSEGQVVMGKFDGQIMIGEDGKQYPVPANYASKSKLVEGDMLKLTITAEGNFVYKQIGPADRKFLIGIAEKDERGNFIIKTEEKKYKVLLAAATYFKIEPGDEITVVVPRDETSTWAAIENIVRKSFEIGAAVESAYQVGKEGESLVDDDEENAPQEEEEEEAPKKPNAIERLQEEIEQERKKQANDDDLIVDEWTPDIEQLKKEAGLPRDRVLRGQPAQAEK